MRYLLKIKAKKKWITVWTEAAAWHEQSRELRLFNIWTAWVIENIKYETISIPLNAYIVYCIKNIVFMFINFYVCKYINLFYFMYICINIFYFMYPWKSQFCGSGDCLNKYYYYS